MPRRLLALTALLAAGCSGSNTKTLVILHTNDEHSHLVGEGPESDDFPTPEAASPTSTLLGGLARRAVLLAQERSDALGKGEDVLTVSAGDNAMGTLPMLAFTQGGPDYQSLALLKYDVTTLGNHEFDFAPAGLAASISSAAASQIGMPQVVASNIHFSGTSGDAALQALFDETGSDTTKKLHRTWIITTSGGIRVGFVGIMGVDAASKAPLKSPTTFSQGVYNASNPVADEAALFNDIQAQVNYLHQQNVDVVVALSHSGVDLQNAENGEDTQIAENVGGIDVIVSGHSHTNYPATLVTNQSTGRQVLIQQAGRFGDHYGRIVMSVKLGASPGDPSPVTFDMTNSTTIPITGATTGDATVEQFVTGVYAQLEQTQVAALGGLSFLEYTVSNTVGMAVTHDSAHVGALSYYNVVKSAYDIHNDVAQKETPLLRATADAMLAATSANVTATNAANASVQGYVPLNQPDLAMEAAGVLRGDVLKNTAGFYSFGDLFQAVPLGISPSEQPGYPLTRFGIYLGELKAAFEVTSGLAYDSTGDADYYLVPSGFCFTYDTSRPEYSSSGSVLDPTNGRVTSIHYQPDHTNLDGCQTSGILLYSNATQALAVSPSGFFASPLTMFTATTNLYVTEFASLAGVVLKDPETGIALAGPTDAIEHTTVGSEIKEWEALGGWLRSLAAAPGANGTLPPIYDDTQATGSASTRAVCSGPLCK